MVNSRAWQLRIILEPLGVSESKEALKIYGVLAEQHRDQSEGAPHGQHG